MPSPLNIERLLSLVAQFESDQHLNGETSELLLLEILQSCGLPVRRSVMLSGKDHHIEVDGEFVAKLEGIEQKFAIEIKHSFRPDTIRSALRQAMRVRHAGKYDRCLVVVRAAKVDSSVDHISAVGGLGYIDLLGGHDLRSWLTKNF